MAVNMHITDSSPDAPGCRPPEHPISGEGPSNRPGRLVKPLTASKHTVCMTPFISKKQTQHRSIYSHL